MNRIRVSSVLGADPSSIEGIARLLDIGNTLQAYNDSDTGQNADHKALKHDWQMIGDDIRYSISRYERGQNVTKPV